MKTQWLMVKNQIKNIKDLFKLRQNYDNFRWNKYFLILIKHIKWDKNNCEKKVIKGCIFIKKESKYSKFRYLFDK